MNFIDSNIWLYAFIQTDGSNRRIKAIDLINSGNSVITTQVINEVCVNLVRKVGFEESAISSLIDSFYRRCFVVGLDHKLMIDASRLRQRYGFSFWDGFIVSGAIRGGCDRLFTEDLQNGLVVDGRLTIENPFHIAKLEDE